MAKDPEKHSEYDDHQHREEELDEEFEDELDEDEEYEDEDDEEDEEEEATDPEHPACPRCGWHNTRPSHIHTMVDKILRTFSIRAFRCRSCGNRFRVIHRAGKS